MAHYRNPNLKRSAKQTDLYLRQSSLAVIIVTIRFQCRCRRYCEKIRVVMSHDSKTMIRVELI
jgi:hypothetical protein